MCGIVGLFLKTQRHEPELGRLTALMLEQMRERGPDSAGFAVYGDDKDDRTKLTVLSEGINTDWGEVCSQLETALNGAVTHRMVLDHAILDPAVVTADSVAIRVCAIAWVPARSARS